MEGFYIIPKAGLGNRLRVILSWLQYAQEKNKSLYVYWEPNKACAGYFLDVFLPVDRLYFLSQKPDRIDYTGYEPKTDIVVDPYIYKYLRPITEIQDKVDALTCRYKPYNAAHIRRTDHAQLAHKNNCYQQDQVFSRFITESIYPVYVATDCMITQQYFLTQHTKKIFIHQMIKHDIKSNNLRQTSLYDSVIDLFMCVNSHAFISTPLSSYSKIIMNIRKSRQI